MHIYNMHNYNTNIFKSTIGKAVFVNMWYMWYNIVYEILHELLKLWCATDSPQAASFFDDNDVNMEFTRADALKQSWLLFCCLADTTSFCTVNVSVLHLEISVHLSGLRKSLRRRGWISQYLPSFGGVRTFSHHQSFYRENPSLWTGKDWQC